MSHTIYSHLIQLTKETDIFEFVHTSSPAIPSTVIPETYRFSKQLVAYVETLVAFSPFYVAGDPRTQGRVDNFYSKALDRYKDFTDKEFHKYIAREMEAFYKRHGFPATKASKIVQEPDESQEPEIGAIVPVEGACALNKSYTMSDSDDDEGEGVAVDTAGGEKPAEAAAAAAAAAPEPAAAAVAVA